MKRVEKMIAFILLFGFFLVPNCLAGYSSVAPGPMVNLGKLSIKNDTRKDIILDEDTLRMCFNLMSVTSPVKLTITENPIPVCFNNQTRVHELLPPGKSCSNGKRKSIIAYTNAKRKSGNQYDFNSPIIRFEVTISISAITDKYGPERKVAMLWMFLAHEIFHMSRLQARDHFNSPTNSEYKAEGFGFAALHKMIGKSHQYHVQKTAQSMIATPVSKELFDKLPVINVVKKRLPIYHGWN